MGDELGAFGAGGGGAGGGQSSASVIHALHMTGVEGEGAGLAGGRVAETEATEGAAELRKAGPVESAHSNFGVVANLRVKIDLRQHDQINGAGRRDWWQRVRHVLHQHEYIC